jgi:uncharacterized protein with FMN-binding domain
MKTIVLSLIIGSATGVPMTPSILSDPATLLAAASTAPLPADTPARVFADGTYTGPSIDAYWGLVQVQAVVQRGQITSLKMLHYPSDRRESLIINQQALPLLRNEVVRAQSAKVDVVSGATLTSQAFIQSLGGALGQAGGTDAAPAEQKPGPAASGSVGI